MYSVLIMAFVSIAWTQEIPVAPYKKLFVDLHNQYRRQEGSSNMQEMVWDDALSREAAEWITTCSYQHKMGDKGENLSFSTHKYNNTVKIRNAMKRYYDEKNRYTYNDQNRCAHYIACHYTQLVWAETNKVGCAMQKCSNYLVWYLACFYSPRANFHKGYPFLKGRACANCDAGQSCHNGLCSGAVSGGSGTDTKTSVNSSCTDNHASCSSWSSRSECYNNPGYMLKNCRKACNNCGPCEDTKDECKTRSWTATCQSNAGSMLRICKKSCGVC